MGTCCPAQHQVMQNITMGTGQLSGMRKTQQGHFSFQKGIGEACFVHRHWSQQATVTRNQQTVVSLRVQRQSYRCSYNLGDLSTCCQVHRAIPQHSLNLQVPICFRHLKHAESLASLPFLPSPPPLLSFSLTSAFPPSVLSSHRHSWLGLP